jgi:hypothetical protein
MTIAEPTGRAVCPAVAGGKRGSSTPQTEDAGKRTGGERLEEATARARASYESDRRVEPLLVHVRLRRPGRERTNRTVYRDFSSRKPCRLATEVRASFVSKPQ